MANKFNSRKTSGTEERKELDDARKDQRKFEGREKNKQRTRSPRDNSSSNSRGSNDNAIKRRMDNATALNFDYPVNTDMGYFSTHNRVVVKDVNLYKVRYIPTLGSDEGANLLAQKNWAYMRSFIGTNQPYDPGDVLCLTQCVESLCLFIEYMKRVVELANTWKLENTLFPKQALLTMGFNVTEVWANINDYREVINRAVEYSSKVVVPTILGTFPFRCALNRVIYADDQTSKCQHIIFEPEGFWKWIPNTKQGDAIMEWAPWPEEPHNISSVTAMFDSMMQILTDQSAQYIYGDVMRAYKDQVSVYKVDFLEDGSYATIIYDPAMLYRLHNATIHSGIGTTAPDITWSMGTEESPTLIQTYHVNSQTSYDDRFILDSPVNDPSSEIVAELCRWKSYAAVPSDSAAVVNDALVGNNNTSSTQSTYPLEILTSMKAYEFDLNTITATYLLPTTFTAVTANLTNHISIEGLAVYPIAYGKKTVNTSSTITFIFGERACYTVLDTAWLDRLNRVYTEAQLATL